MESYQAIYDAIRSRIGNCDVGAAIESAIGNAQLAHHAEQAANSVHYAAASYERPSIQFRPALSVDGTMWCASYGNNLQDGVAGFGGSPHEAMLDFDAAWYAKLKNTEGEQG